MKQYRDHYFLKAKKEKYPARSVYKLKELNKKFNIFKKGMKVLDLGAAPGSWTLETAEKVGVQGLVLSVDIMETQTIFPENVTFIQEDIINRSMDFENILKTFGSFHVVLSDMAPCTTGTRFTDQARSLELALQALDIAQNWLKPRGSFVVKIFMGPDIQELIKPMRLSFDFVKSFKPQSSRPESKEIFFVGLNFKKL